MQRLKDRVYIVTGAAGGIGAAVCRCIAAEGGHVVLTDQHPERLEATARRVRDAGVQALPVTADVLDAASAPRVVNEALSRFDRLDGGVMCAGVIKLRSIMDIDPVQWDRTIGINLRGAFFLTQAVARAMIERGCKGSIVTISSTSGTGARPDCADYGISKAGINSMTRSFALQLGPSGIRVNAVAPGVTETEMFHQVDRERGALRGKKPGELTTDYAREIPLRRTAAPEDIARPIIFLLSDESAYLTGEVILVDGGFKLNHN
jgi:NAD(P)-dependent dehydrogenase (short-subunit alcohol dehydrogenase family)